MSASPHEVSRLNMRVVKEFGYHDDHAVGEVIPVSLEHVGDLIQKGYAEIVVNNLGYNADFDMPTPGEFESLFKEYEQAEAEECQPAGTSVPVQEGGR